MGIEKWRDSPMMRLRVNSMQWGLFIADAVIFRG